MFERHRAFANFAIIAESQYADFEACLFSNAMPDAIPRATRSGPQCVQRGVRQFLASNDRVLDAACELQRHARHAGPLTGINQQSVAATKSIQKGNTINGGHALDIDLARDLQQIARRESTGARNTNREKMKCKQALLRIHATGYNSKTRQFGKASACPGRGRQMSPNGNSEGRKAHYARRESAQPIGDDEARGGQCRALHHCPEGAGVQSKPSCCECMCHLHFVRDRDAHHSLFACARQRQLQPSL